MSIRIQNLKSKINSSFELNIEHLEIEAGEILGIGGQNGSGKSSLFEAILGNIAFEGKIDSKETAVVYQEANVFTHLSVAENVTLGLDSNKDSVLNEMLSLFDLKEFEFIKADSLSGGQTQRVAIARSLALDLPTLLLDESFNQIDDITKGRILPKLRAYLKDKNISCILICHDFNDLEIFCDSIAILKQGRMVHHSSIESKADLSKAKELI